MNNRIHLRRTPAVLCAAALLAALGTPLLAQQKTFNFGPPLRPNILFAYKYVERVVERHEIGGDVVDSSTRVLTYYITERQTSSSEGKGVHAIEANVDSMTIDIRGMSEPIFFNTQQIEHVSDRTLVAHRDVFGPSVIVNRAITFVLSPYGEVLRVESPSRKQALEDLKDDLIDPFTRERLREVLTDEYLASVYLPWRGVLPLGRKVPYDKENRVPFLTAFNRSSFRDTALGKVVTGPDGTPHYTFRADLERPINTMVTVSGFEEPLKMGTMAGTMNGDLKLDDDGVVVSGWVITKGTLSTLRSGMPLKSTISHEVYFESMGMTPFASTN